MMVNVVGILMIACGAATLYIGARLDYEAAMKQDGCVQRAKIVEAWEPMERNRFLVNGESQKDSKGRDLFYAAEDVDANIEKINKVLRGE